MKKFKWLCKLDCTKRLRSDEGEIQKGQTDLRKGIQNEYNIIKHLDIKSINKDYIIFVCEELTENQ